MSQSFADILIALQSPDCGLLRHEAGSAAFYDDDENDRLEAMYKEAVEAFRATDGPPLDPPPILPKMDSHRAACWLRGDKVLYVTFTYMDNTRYCALQLGLIPRGTVTLRQAED